MSSYLPSAMSRSIARVSWEAINNMLAQHQVGQVDVRSAAEQARWTNSEPG